MNILASYNWLKEYIKTNKSAEDFAREFSLRSMAVESIEDLSAKYDKMVVGVVKEVKAHPNADKLKIAITDVGARHDSPVQIVCGGANLADGMRVFVALPGAKVRWHGEGDLVELKETKIRGESSFGMICAASEVGFEKVASGPKDIWDLGSLTQAKAGTSIADALDLNDTIFDIEITTNRPECMGIVGLAREGAAALEEKFEFTPPSLPKGAIEKPVVVKVEDGDLCPRYMAVVIDGVKVGPSPLWLQTKILLSGHRPINNIVDISNYVLHEYGQPMHAFDYDKLADGKIIVRRAKKGESIKALDDNDYEFKKDNLVIADAAGPIAVAGVMGGKESGTWDGTTTIVLEAANFDAISVRKTSRALNLYSDSQLLFEKGLSTEATEMALARAVELTMEIAGGHVASDIVDIQASAYEAPVFPFRPQKVRDLLGVEISDEEQLTILSRLGFTAEQSGEDYTVTVPSWRDHDIEAEVDFAEEIARIYGYHNMPAVLPDMAPPSYAGDKDLAWEIKTKRFLAASGFTEFYGLSFVGKEDMKRYGQDPDDAVALLNPLSSDLTHMRPSLMPSMLRDIESNQGETPFGRVFELARVYIPNKGDLPTERTELVLAEFGITNAEESFRRVKGVLEAFAAKTNVELTLERLMDDEHWHASRSAAIMFKGERVGALGQISQADQDSFGINRAVMALSLDFYALLDDLSDTKRYEEIPEFPSVTRDLAVVVDVTTPYADLEKTVRQQSGLIDSVDLIETYQGAGIAEGKKSVTLSLTLRSPEKTLESQHVDDVMKAVELALERAFGAVIR
jgi:phenylalanyl-tRNA synthetase beta chain